MSTPPKSVPAVSTPTGYNEVLVDPLHGQGRVTSGFGPRIAPTPNASTNHKGVDLAAPLGTPVAAAASGTVIRAQETGSAGNQVIIDHGNNTQTTYDHLSEIDVTKGQTVSQGEIIGKVGSTGRSTGPHLHYEVAQNGVPVNPYGKTIGVNANQSPAGKVAAGATPAPSPQDVAKDAAAAQARQIFKERAYELNYNQDEILRKIIAGDTFLPNLTNDFYNFTYHWRLFATADTDLLTETAINADTKIDTFFEKIAEYEQITIAESGVTAMTIDSVSMNSVVGTDYQISSTSFTSIEMKITEPNGAVFMDALRNAGLKLNVRNYEKTFYYLELTFKGYDEDGEINIEPLSSLPNGGRWLWSVTITDIDVSISAGGGTYTLKMIPVADSLTANRFNIVPAATQISGGTIGEFFDNFTKALNDHWAEVKSGKDIITFEARFHPVEDLLTVDEVKSLSIKPVQEEQNTERSVQFGVDGRTAQIMRGATISQVLDAVMMSCEGAQKLALDMKPEEIINDKNGNINATGYRQSILWRIEPEVHYTGYDPVFSDYKRKFILHIYGFRNHACVLSTQESRTGADIQKAIITELAYRNFMQKKYEYLFTGVNTEVIDLDLNFNLKWSTILPRLVQSNQEQVEVHAKALTPDTENKKSDTDKINKLRNAQGKDNFIAAKTQEAGAIANQASQSLFDAEAALSDAQNDPLKKNDKELIQKLTLDVKKKRDQVQKNIGYLDNLRTQLDEKYPQTQPSKTYEREYGEDLTGSKLELNSSIVRDRDTFPITLDNYDPNSTTGMAGQTHSGKSVYGVVLNQAYGQLTQQLMTIDLSIRGDPFWLGAGSFEQIITKTSDVFTNKQPNFSQGCSTFILKFAYPLGQDDDGNLLLNNNETVTGVYQVTRIAHRFEDGKFSQTLTAIRVPIVDLFASVYKQDHPDANPQTEDEKQTDALLGVPKKYTGPLSVTPKTPTTSVDPFFNGKKAPLITGTFGTTTPSSIDPLLAARNRGPLLPRGN